MTPLHQYKDDREFIKDMAELAADLRILKEWKEEVEEKHAKLDKRVDHLELAWHDFKKSQDTIGRWLKAIFSFVAGIGADTGAYDFWRYIGKDLGWGRDTMYKVAVAVMFGLFAVGISFIVPHGKRKPKEGESK